MPEGIGAAIKEIEREIFMLQQLASSRKSIYRGRTLTNPARSGRRGRRRLSPDARRPISQAAKKRWASLRGTRKAPKTAQSKE